MPARYIEKFDNVAGTISAVFPTLAAEFDEDPELSTPMVDTVGSEFGYDFLRFGPSLVRTVNIRVRGIYSGDTATLHDTAIDDLRSKCYRVGFGKLYTLHADGTRRWCYARLTQIPTISFSPRNELFSPFVAGFRRETPWRATALNAGGGPFTITTDDQVITVNNPGNINVTAMDIRLRANNATPWATPAVYNQTTNQWLQIGRIGASANEELLIATYRPMNYFSNNDGASYSEDYAQLQRGGSASADWFTLIPGNNSVQIQQNAGGSTPSLNVEFSFYPAYA